MSTPDPRLTRRDAERLLDAPAEHDGLLGWALTAAIAPAHAEELRREDAVVAAFHAARVSPAPASRAGYVSPSRLGGRAATRAVVATGAVVALMSGGFALASSADLPGVPELPDLPALPGQAADRATESVAEAPRGAAGTATSGTSATSGEDGARTSPSGSATGPGPSGAGDPSGSATPSTSPDDTSAPSPSLEGLCRAFQATDRADAGSSLDSAAFQALAAAAGGTDRIATYCVDLVGPPRQTGKPTDTASPTTRPGPTKPAPTKPTPIKPTPTKPTPSPGKPSDQPTASPGKPTDQPTASPGKPTDQPSPSPGKQSDLPTPDGSGGPDRPDDPGKGGAHQSSG